MDEGRHGSDGHGRPQATRPPRSRGSIWREDRVLEERRVGPERREHETLVEEERRVTERRVPPPVEMERRNYILARAGQVVDYLFYLLYGLLAIRFVLALLGASEAAGFVQFINGITQPFYGPFAGIVTRPAIDGGFIDFPVIIALLAYGLLHVAIRGLLRLGASGGRGGDVPPSA
jgi:uncharacterized protein YggT (Ycf19 family)